jgi:hypothetical protein
MESAPLQLLRTFFVFRRTKKQSKNFSRFLSNENVRFFNKYKSVLFCSVLKIATRAAE